MSDEVVSFINRDHIVLVTIDRGEIVVTTTAGTTITTIPASAATLGKFVDPPSYYFLLRARLRRDKTARLVI